MYFYNVRQVQSDFRREFGAPAPIRLSSSSSGYSAHQRYHSRSLRRLVLISAIFTLVLALFITSIHGSESDESSSPSPQMPNIQLSKHPILIVLSFDGFRYNYFEKADTPNMDEIGYHGVRTVMKNEFPTKTFPNHQSIVTGLHPESHGIVGNSFYDPKYKKVLHVQDENFWNFREDILPIWILNEKAGDNRTSGVMTWPGGEIPYGPSSNLTTPTFYHKYNNSFPFEARVDMIISWITNGANLIFGYFEEPDENAHAWGPESNQTKGWIQKMDNLTGYFIDKLKENNIYDKVNIILLSDHGFHSVPAKNIMNVTKAVTIDSSKYIISGKSPVITVAPIVETALEPLYNQFLNISKTHNFTVYKKSEINEYKSYWFYQDNRRIQPLILVADPGFVFDDFYDDIFNYYSKPPFNHKYSEDAVYGTHGYDNHEISMHPFFMAHGPLFHSDGREVNSFHNIDLFPLFGYVCGFELPANNGSTMAIKLLLEQKRQFHLSPTGVGWIVVIAVVFGLAILSVILSFLRQGTARRKLDHRYNDQSLLNSSNNSVTGYRFINKKDDLDDEYEDEDYYDEDENQVLIPSSVDRDRDHIISSPGSNFGGRFVEIDVNDDDNVEDKKQKSLDEFEMIEGDTEQLRTVEPVSQQRPVSNSQDNNITSTNYNGGGQMLSILKNMLDDEDVEEFNIPARNNRVHFA